MIKDRCLQWESFPERILRKIFSYLDPDERARVSGVCKTWAHVADCPDYWRNSVFSFSEANRKDIKQPSCPRQIVRKYGQLFRNLTIVYNSNPRNSLKFLPRQVKGFLVALKEHGVQLDSLRINKIMKFTKQRRLDRRLEQMTEFLATQTNLSEVDFTNGKMDVSRGLQVLESLQPERVNRLSLQNFFVNWSDVSRSEYQRYMRDISKFTNIKTLCMSYENMSDRVLECLCSGINGQLETLSVLYQGTAMPNNSISDRGWTLLKEACPQMGVEFTLDLTVRVTAWQIITWNILSPAIPLGRIYIYIPRWNILDQFIFYHLNENYAKTLREAVFDLRGDNNADVVDIVCECVRQCLILNSLTLRVRFPDFEMQELFHRLYNTIALERKMHPVSLKEFRATFRGLPTRQQNSVPYLKISYGDLFRNIGVEFKLKYKQ